jgi:hypothetical protein
VDLSAAAAISAFNPQNALTTNSQPPAVNQALDQANATPFVIPGAANVPDVLAQSAAGNSLGALTSGVFLASVASGVATPPLSVVANQGESSGIPITAVLGSNSTEFPNQNVSASEALAAYQFQQNLLATTGSTGAGAIYAQQLAATTQAINSASSVNLLA